MAAYKRLATRCLLVLCALFMLSGCAERNTDQNLDKELFLKALTQAGLKVEKTAGTHMADLFKVPAESETGIWTDKGFINAVFFPSSLQDKVTVEKVAEYTWKFHGLPTEVEMASNHTWYFHVYRNVIILTDSQELHATLTGIFK